MLKVGVPFLNRYLLMLRLQLVGEVPVKISGKKGLRKIILEHRWGMISFLANKYSIQGSRNWTFSLKFYKVKSKAVPLHAMEALGGRGGIAPTHSRPRH
jgi:hypothetical protein